MDQRTRNDEQGHDARHSGLGYSAIALGLAVGGASVAMGYFPVAGTVLVSLGVAYFASREETEEKTDATAARVSVPPSRPSLA